MTGALYNFQNEIDKFGSEVRDRSDQILLASVIELHTSVRVGSRVTGSPGAPKATGYLQNSIQIGRGPTIAFKQDGKGPTKGEVVPTPPDVSDLVGLKLGEVVTVATNTVYAEVQEHMHKTHANHWALSQAGWPRIVQMFIDQILGK
jgi:hypothetical protein